MSKSIGSVHNVPTTQIGTLLNQARAFTRIADAEIERMRSDLANTAVETFVVVGTNLNFATELYLKAAQFLSTGTYPHGHDLYNLFNDLPESNRATLAGMFEDQWKMISSSNANVGYFMRSLEQHSAEASKRMLDAEIESFDIRAKDGLLAVVLEDNRLGFKKWRYIFEEITTSSDEIHKIYFGHLQCFCHLADAFLRPIAAQQGHHIS